MIVVQSRSLCGIDAELYGRGGLECLISNVVSGPGSSVGRATDFKARKHWEPRAGRNRTATSGCRKLLGRPESPRHHNVAGNGGREGRKRRGIGSSAGEGPAERRLRLQRLDAARLRRRWDSPDFQHPKRPVGGSRWSVKADEVR